MFTDPERIKLADKGHPDICNVYSYYSTFLPQVKKEVYDWCTNAKIGCTECKKRLAMGLIEVFAPLHKKRQELTKDKAGIKRILEKGKEKAASFAAKTIKEAKEAMKILL